MNISLDKAASEAANKIDESEINDSNTQVSSTILVEDIKERGDIVQTVIIIAMFVVIVVVFGSIMSSAISGKAQQISDKISEVEVNPTQAPTTPADDTDDYNNSPW